MAFKKTLVQRLFNLSRFSTPTTGSRKPPLPDPKMKRAQQRRPLTQSAAALPAGFRLFPPAAGETLAEKLRGMDISRDRIRLDGLIPFPAREKDAPAPAPAPMSASEVRKVVRAAQVEMVREKLREIPNDWVSYNEFVQICKECCGGNSDQAFSFAKMLDDSGSVIILGSNVCIRPHQVAKAIQTLVTPPTSTAEDPRMEELEEMEKQMAEIDQKADALVRRELWAGLGYLVVQTAAFMRLTFWELSWDVMEPICFYVTTFYFMLGYAFFLRTSREPTFEGFFQSRFAAKQRKLIKAHNFDVEKYYELKKAFDPQFSPAIDDTKLIKFGDFHKKYSLSN